jgi:hypothetical protein
MTEAFDEAMLQETPLKPFQIFLGGSARHLGIQMARGKTLDAEGGNTNQILLLEIHNEQSVVSHPITRKHATGMSDHHILCCQDAVDGFGSMKEGRLNFSSREITDHL